MDPRSERLPVGDGGFQVPSLGAKGRSPLRCSRTSSSSGAISPARRLPRSTCCRRHPPFHGQCRIAGPWYSMTCPVPPPVPICPDDSEDDILRFEPGRKPAGDLDPQRLGPRSLPEASGWPARARPRWCRSRTPARRMRRGCWCGCRRRRWSYPEVSAPARDRSHGRCLGGRSGCHRA